MDIYMIKIYTCQRMTGRYCDEMRLEAEMLKNALREYGFLALNPVIEEGIPYEHKLLENVPVEQLERHWRRDKEMIRESDVLLDYKTQNASDGSNKEVAYNRFCLWKPTVRVWDGQGGLISRIEDDLVVPTLQEALLLISDKWDTYEKLRLWREGMLSKSFPKWEAYQHELTRRYSQKTITLEVIK